MFTRFIFFIACCVSLCMGLTDAYFALVADAMGNKAASVGVFDLVAKLNVRGGAFGLGQAPEAAFGLCYSRLLGESCV